MDAGDNISYIGDEIAKENQHYLTLPSKCPISKYKWQMDNGVYFLPLTIEVVADRVIGMDVLVLCNFSI